MTVMSSTKIRPYASTIFRDSWWAKSVLLNFLSFMDLRYDLFDFFPRVGSFFLKVPLGLSDSLVGLLHKERMTHHFPDEDSQDATGLDFPGDRPVENDRNDSGLRLFQAVSRQVATPFHLEKVREEYCPFPLSISILEVTECFRTVVTFPNLFLCLG